ncbi:MAG: hypothetical protein ACF8NJ_08175, partial [Phycisphaerales bacterium JB038]
MTRSPLSCRRARRTIGVVLRAGAALALLATLPAQAVTPTVVARQFGNVEEDAVWWELEEIGPALADTWLLGRTNWTDGRGSLLWAESGIKLRASDLTVSDHPLQDQGVAVGVASFARGFSVTADGLVVNGVLRSDEAALAGEEAVGRCVHDDCTYLFSSFDEMLLGGELVSPSGVADVAATRSGQVYAALQLRGGLSPQYGLVRTTGGPPPGHVEGVLLTGQAIRDSAGAVVGTLDDLIVPDDGRVLAVLPWSGETLLLATVDEPGNGRQRHVLRSGLSVRRPGETVAGLPIERLSGAALGEGGELFYAGLLTQGGDVSSDNDAFLAYGDSIVSREGDPCPGLAGATFIGDTPALAADHWGNAAFIGEALAADGARLDVLYYNGELLLRSGDLLDANGDGVIDADDHGATVVDLLAAGDLVLGRRSAWVLATAVLPQYGLRTVLLRLGPLPEIANPWDARTPCPGDVTGDRL